MKKLTGFLSLAAAGLLALLVFILVPIHAEAKVLESGKTVPLKLKDVVNYKFTIKEDSLVQFQWSNNVNDRTSIIVYQDSAKTRIIDSAYPSAETGTLSIALKAGTYYARMYDGSALYEPVAKVKYTATPASKINKDNYCRGKAIALKANTNAKIVQTPLYDYTRWYKITLPKAQKVTINISSGSQYYIDLYSPSMQTYNSLVSSKSIVTQDKLAAGTYFIIVSPRHSYAQNVAGTYYVFKWK